MNANNIVSTYKLQPVDGRKSFYNKARVKVYSDGAKVLESYGTDICRLCTDGTLERLWDSCSATTQRHIEAFTGLTQKEYEERTYKSVYKLKQTRFYIGGGQYDTIIEDIEL